MSKYTAEQVATKASQLATDDEYPDKHAADMLRDYAAHLREREAAKAQWTPYLKEAQTPFERFMQEVKDCNSCLELLKQERLKSEAAKAGVTDEVVTAAIAAFNGTGLAMMTLDRADVRSMHAALETVAPMLASVRVPEREALEAIKRLPARPFPDPVAHSWEAFGRAVMGTFTDAKFIAIRALAAAPKRGEG